MDMTPEQITALHVWTAAAKTTLLGGYGLGSSYIDTRARGGSDYTARRAYVRLDHETAKQVPELRGQSRQDVEAILDAATAAAEQLLASATALLEIAKDALLDLEVMALGADPTKWSSLFRRIDHIRATIAAAEGKAPP